MFPGPYCLVEFQDTGTLSSGFPLDDRGERLHKEGFSGFLKKPYGEEELGALVHGLLQDRGT